MRNIKLGDYITFTATTRSGRQVATRKVNGFYNGYPTVRYMGYADFVVGQFPGDVIHSVQPPA